MSEIACYYSQILHLNKHIYFNKEEVHPQNISSGGKYNVLILVDLYFTQVLLVLHTHTFTYTKFTLYQQIKSLSRKACQGLMVL